MKVSKLRIVVFVGILIRLILWCFQVDPAGDDGMRYMTETINLVDYGVFSTDWNVTPPNLPEPGAHDLPLWPLTMAIFYMLTHSVKMTQYASVLLNIGLMCIALKFLCSLLKSKPFNCNDRSCAIGCAVFLFMPDSIIYSLFHMPDMMAVCLITIGVWAYFRYIMMATTFYMLVYGVAFGLAILAKPICLPLFCALTIALPLVMKSSIIKKILMMIVAFAIVSCMLAPWVIRNKNTFGTAGLTTISGTNLYGCNWGRLVGELATEEKAKCIDDMNDFHQSLVGYDKMAMSKKMGKYAKTQILTHLPQYIVFTLKVHPKLYGGTGTVALMRFLGQYRIAWALDDTWGSGNHAPQSQRVKYSQFHILVGCSVQIISWLILLSGYFFIGIGLFNMLKKSIPAENWTKRLVYMCPIFCLILLALVIGPITSTRYRFIMILFFAILAAHSCKPKTN